MTSFLGLLTYLAVNIVNIVFFWRFRREKFNWFFNAVVPIFGIVVVLYILYNSYLASLWAAAWTYGQRIALAVVIWLLAGLACTLWQRRRSRGSFKRTAK